MVRKISALVLAVCILGICGGCRRTKTGVRVVDRISVQWEEHGAAVQHIYENPDKMQLILNRLRTLGQRFSSDADPDLLEVPVLTVTLFYSDGQQKQYQIKPDRYVRIGQSPWQQADPRQVTSLRLLLQSLPGDFQT